MTNLSEEEYKKIRDQVQERFNKRTEFAMHFVAYVFVNMALYLGLAKLIGLNAPIPLLISLLWGAGLLMHGIQVAFETGIWIKAQERAIQREVELALYYKEGRVPSFVKKRKNEEKFSHLRIGYDGELVAVDDDVEDLTETNHKI